VRAFGILIHCYNVEQQSWIRQACLREGKWKKDRKRAGLKTFWDTDMIGKKEGFT